MMAVLHCGTSGVAGDQPHIVLDRSQILLPYLKEGVSLAHNAQEQTDLAPYSTHEVREFAGHANIRTTEVYFIRKVVARPCGLLLPILPEPGYLRYAGRRTFPMLRPEEFL